MNFAISYALLELLTALWAIRSITSVYYVDWLSILDCIHIELLEIVGPQPRELQLELQVTINTISHTQKLGKTHGELWNSWNGHLLERSKI